MTSVRQRAAQVRDVPKKAARRGTARTATKASASTARTSPGSAARGEPPTTSSVVQVRLHADEIVELRDAMRLLSLASRSEALREGIRLLVREAREIAAADEIRRFYGGQQAPLPEGVAPATAEELAAADREQW